MTSPGPYNPPPAPPLNAPPPQGTPVGVTPGQNPAVVVANKVIVFGENGGIFVYSGTPAAGNLIASITATAGTDPYGNAYQEGVTAYVTITSGFPGTYAVELANQTEVWGTALAALLFSNLTDPPAIAPAVTAQGSSGGTAINLQSGASDGSAEGAYFAALDSVNAGIPGGLCLATCGANQVASVDGNTYDTQRLSMLFSGGPQDITSTTPAPILGMDASVAAGTYLIEGVIWIEQGGGAVAQTMGFTGPATSDVSISNNWVIATTFAGNVNYRRLTSLTTGNSPALTATTVYEWHIKGKITFTGAGTFKAVAAQGTSGDNWSILDGYLNLLPVTA